MDKSYFEVIRPGINTTFQDLGRKNLYHIGIPFSGAMDNRNFILANAIAGNKENTPVIEFAYQGPLLKFKGEKININITGNASFKLIKKEEQIEGNCYENYTLEEGDQLDIISTNKSVYGYLAISGNFEVQFQWNSCSTNTKAKVGANDGEKIEKDQLIKILDSHSHNSKRKLEYTNSKIENIRVIKGTNFNYFSKEGKKNFFEKEFIVTKLTDRMGMRLEGCKIENIVDTNIKSEGLIKGTIQVPADGNPIIMLSDHGTIGGYPKIGVVISADYDKLVQLPPGSKIKFQEIELADAEMLFKLYQMETKNLVLKIK
jgi:biotin-dependent carboxylase-like uncharacterized protein|tara:strand:+ start:3960 stop:4907 length:948 start_codon:yes stop_codon:yes gene_type:complete